MGVGRRQQQIRAMRGQMWSPGRPSTARREDRVRFWEAIARGRRVRTLPQRPECHARLATGGSARLAGWHRSRWRRCQADTCRFPSGRRSRSCTRRRLECDRSLVALAVRPRRSPGSCAATRPRAATARRIARRPRTGTRSVAPVARRCPSWPPTTPCVTTSSSASPVRSPDPTGGRCPVPMFAGSAVGTAGEQTAGEPRRGAPSRSPTGCASISSMVVIPRNVGHLLEHESQLVRVDELGNERLIRVVEPVA
jgi:hypothetical protein